MNQNIYDNEVFFEKYSQMNRSIYGLKGAGEWETFKKMMPKLESKRVLDLGCGYGWHCKYAVDNQAAFVIGLDSSEKMLERAQDINGDSCIQYLRGTIEEVELEKESFDVVISSLALHYVEDFRMVCEKVYACLKNGGEFLFSVEHPIFTAEGTQLWYCDELGNQLHWPVDRYFYEGKRESVFLGEKVVKYHKTLTTYLNVLLGCGFMIKAVIEPMPSKELLESVAGMEAELRRPMMLLISVIKFES